MKDVHGERIDARICEYCGQKASKRNLLLFHMYTKHGIQPPKNCTFPHCDRCDYVALSESLLTKHKQNHEVNKEFRCTVRNKYLFCTCKRNLYNVVNFVIKFNEMSLNFRADLQCNFQNKCCFTRTYVC